MVEELQRQLANETSGSLVPLLTRSVRLAHLANEPEYAALFELHLDGFDKNKSAGARVTPWADAARQPKWDPVQAFFQDRTVSGGQVQGLALEQIESLREEIRSELRGLQDRSPGAGALLLTAQEYTAILSRIRNRVGVFANTVEKSILRPSGAPPPGSAPAKIFIGHGRSPAWLELKNFLEQRLGLPVVEFNMESPAGVSTSERLEQMRVRHTSRLSCSPPKIRGRTGQCTRERM